MISFNIPIPTSPTIDHNTTITAKAINNNHNNDSNKSKSKKQQKQLSIESSLLAAASKNTANNTNTITNSSEQCALIIKATNRVTICNYDKVFEINGKATLSLSKVGDNYYHNHYHYLYLYTKTHYYYLYYKRFMRVW